MNLNRLRGSVCAVLIVACGILYAFTHTRTSAAQSAGFTVEQVLSAPFPSDLVASPRGERIAWAFDWQGKRNVWAAEGPDFKPRQLTQYNEDTGQELTELSFSHDGNWVIYVRGGGPNGSGEIPNPTSDPVGVAQSIYAVSFADGRLRKLGDGDSPVASPADNRVVFNKDGQLWVVELAEGSEPHPYFAVRGNTSSPQWSPNGRYLAFVSNRNSHSFIGVLDTEQRSLKYLAPSVDRDTTPRWSPDGKRIAFIRQPARGSQPRPIFQEVPDPWTIWVAEVDSGAGKEVWRSGMKLEDSLPRMAGENVLNWGANDRLVFASEMDGWQRLYSIGTSSAGEPIALSPAKCEWEHLSLSPDRKEVFYSSNCGDTNRRHIWKASVADGKHAPMTSGATIEWTPVPTASGQTLAFLGADAQVPGTVQVMPAGGGKPKALHEKPANFPAGLVTPKEVVFKAADGLDIHGQLFLPANAKPTNKLPAVIFTHGGPPRQMLLGWHYMYYYHNTYAFNQYLASKGYAVLSVNYRLGIGYGRAFRQPKNGGARGAAEYQDVLAGAAYLRARSDIDASRIGLWGGSYGGFLTALGLARNSDLFACGVDLHGVHDWSARFSSATWIEYGDRDVVKIARESSPIASVEKWRSPVLLVHGDDDRNVAFTQTIDLVRKLRELKVEYEQIIYPDEVHDFLLHKNWAEIFNAAGKFFDKHLKGTSRGVQTGQRVSKVDLLLRGGSLIDGTGSAAFRADIGIAGDRIVFVGDAANEKIEADRTVDVAGQIVSPGFIDPHTHADEELFDAKRSGNLPFLTQGVTTVFIGSDGRSRIPFGKTLDQLQAQGVGTNVASFVGHGSVRQAVMGMADAAPTAEQLEKMKALVRQGMQEGAIGLSTGLYYAPGNFAKTEEVIELSRVAAEFGGVYDTHQRDESSYTIGLLASIEEVIRIGREARIPVHISHIKALGADVWGQSVKAIEIIERARREGIDVTANQYPYVASGSSVTASLVPRWAENGGNAELLKRIDDPAVRPRLVTEMEANLKRRGGPESLMMRPTSSNRAIAGKTLGALAKEWNVPPVEAALKIIKMGGSGAVSFNMTEKDIENFMRQPWVMTGSDGSSGHPRKYGSFPRKIREYALNRKVISLPRAIQSSSLQVAETFHLKDRGKIAAGYFADVVVFDEKTIADQSTYDEPEKFTVGMNYVIVNGKVAIENGRFNGALAGRTLRK